jgi:hypothetical protein
MAIRHLAAALLIGMTPELFGASFAPRDVVALSSQAIVRIDIDSGTQTSVAFDAFEAIPRSTVIATDRDCVFVAHVNVPNFNVDLARFDIATETWTLLPTQAGAVAPWDMDLMPDGNLMISHEFALIGVDPQTGEAFASRVRFPPQEDLNIRSVEVDSSGAIISNFIPSGSFPDFWLVRQRPGVAVPDLYDLEFGFIDYALASDTELVGLRGVGDSTIQLHRVALDTGASELIFEGDIFGVHAEKVLVDPVGRILLLAPERKQIARLDLALGTEQLVTLDVNVFDFDVVPIPEPSSILLLTMGLFALLAHTLVARVRAKAAR